MEQLGVILGLIGGILTILGVLVSVVFFIVRISAKVALHDKALKDNIEDTTAAHDKIRQITPQIQELATQARETQVHVSYIRQGIDELKQRIPVAQ